MKKLLISSTYLFIYYLFRLLIFAFSHPTLATFFSIVLSLLDILQIESRNNLIKLKLSKEKIKLKPNSEFID